MEMNHFTKCVTFLCVIAVLMLFIGCKKNAPETLTPKITNDKVEVTATSATFTWTVDWPGKLMSVVEVSENEDMSHSQCYGSETETEDHDFTVMVTNLKANTKYYYRFLVWNRNFVDNKFVIKEKCLYTLTQQKPTVTTLSVTQINYTQSTAICGGDVISDGNDAVIERGIYFGTSSNPSATGIKLAASSASTGSFTCTMTGLEKGTYYVCAYATNGQGTSYGSEKSFSYNPPPIGAINGIFSVSSTKKVYFSQGNLQYRASDGRWRFADHQYNSLGSSNSSISSSNSAFIDLFGWGTSGWNSGAICYLPYSTSTSSSSYYPGGNPDNSLTNNYANADWGVYNKIYNGGNTPGQWRTLTNDEWVYVFQNRSNASSKFGHGCVNGINGMILLPDNWTQPMGLSFIAGNSDWANSYTTAEWAQMEANGAVFMPAAGGRRGSEVSYTNNRGHYWSSSRLSNNNAYDMYFEKNKVTPTDPFTGRFFGCSVRLVKDVQ